MTGIPELLKAAADRLRQLPGVTSAKAQLDPLDLDILEQESFKGPAIRVVFATAKPQLRQGGGLDLEVSFGIFCIAVREGRPDPDMASADIAAISLAIGACAAVMADAYIGLTRLTPVVPSDIRVHAGEASSKKGVALVGIECVTTLLDVIDEARIIAAAAETGKAPQTADQYQINDQPPEAIPPPPPETP